MLKNPKIIISLALGLCFSAAAVYFSFRNIPLAELMAFMQTIQWQWILLSTLTGLSTYFVRALRWQVILSPVRKLSFWHAYHPLVIAFMVNSILPGRVGELARPAILDRRDGIPFSRGIATVGVERVFDFLMLLGLFVFFLSGIEPDPGIGIDFNGYRIDQVTLYAILRKFIAACIFLMILIVLLMLPVARRGLSRFFSWLPHLLILAPGHFREKMSSRVELRSHAILENLALGFDILRNPAKVAACLSLSALVWLLTCASFYVLSLGSQGVSVTFSQISAATIILCFFITLPSVPGYWGLWEAGGIYGLMLFGVPRVEAAGITLTFHFFQIVPIILLGLVSAWMTGVGILSSSYGSNTGKVSS
jgi:uncharacterized protein (TIRG00374 family)